MVKIRAAVALIPVAALALTLAGCSGSAKGGLEQDCIEQAAAKVGLSPSELTVTERLETPGGSLDWRGTYPGGHFACAGATDSDVLFQVVTYED